MTTFDDKPMAARGLESYRYRSSYGWIMIGAIDDQDALKEAGRSLSRGVLAVENLQRWNGTAYEDCACRGM